ncbi:hypothetical protein ABE042_21965 [Viridibacillus arvi]|uniref:hypothetical protein n=1 Tax=Viridibacillus arvi TaxID=263475 RepID=UPI003D288335
MNITWKDLLIIGLGAIIGLLATFKLIDLMILDDKNIEVAVVGFLGTISGGVLSGAITLIGVKITIDYYKENDVKQSEKQKKSIDLAAKLNDAKERDRIRLNYLLNKNEEITQLVIEIKDNLIVYFNTLSRYVEYQEKSCKTKLEINENIALDSTHIYRDYIKSLEYKFSNQVEYKNKTLDKDTETRTLIIKKLSELKSKNIYIEDIDFNDIYQQINNLFIKIQDIIKPNIHLPENFLKNYESKTKSLRGIINDSNTEMDKELSVILNKCVSYSKKLLDSILLKESE